MHPLWLSHTLQKKNHQYDPPHAILGYLIHLQIQIQMENRILKKFQEKNSPQLDIMPCSVRFDYDGIFGEEYTPLNRLQNYQNSFFNYRRTHRQNPQKSKSLKNQISYTKINEFGKKMIENPLKNKINEKSLQNKLFAHGIRTQFNKLKLNKILKQNMALKDEIQRKEIVINQLTQNEIRLKQYLNNKEKLIQMLNDKIKEDCKNTSINNQQVINEKEQIIHNLKYSLQILNQKQIKREKELKMILKAFQQSNQLIENKQRLIKHLKQEINEIKLKLKHQTKIQNQNKIIETKKKETNHFNHLKCRSPSIKDLREFQVTFDNTNLKNERSFKNLQSKKFGQIKVQRMNKNENKKIDNFNKLIENINFDFL